MKKFINFILVGAVTLGCFGITACKDSEDANANATIFVPFNQIGRFEIADMQFLPGIDPSKVALLSKDPNVLSVENGSIEAISVGKTTITATYSDLVQTQTVEVVKAESDPQIKLNDIPIFLGQSVAVAPKLIYSDRVIDGVSFTLISEDPTVATVTENTVNGVTYGQTNIIVEAYILNNKVASETVVCTVGHNSGISPEFSAYDLYVTGEIKGESFTTELDLSGQVIVDGQEVDGAAIEWTVGDDSIAKIEDGKIKAVGLGSTYLVATYSSNGTTLKTSNLPVNVNVPIWDSKDGNRPDVIIDLDKQTQEFDATEILGEGHSMGYIESVNGGIKKEITDNKLLVTGLTSGEYDCVAYNSDKTLGVRINLHVADYVVYDYDDLKEIAAPEHLSGYTVLANDVSCAAGDGYKTAYRGATDASGVKVNIFTGVFNGLGHVISDFGKGVAGMGLYEDSAGGLFKNVAITGFNLDNESAAALFYRTVQKSETIVDNVYVEAFYKNGSYQFAGGICALSFDGPVKISNTIVKVEGSYSGNVGSYVGRARETVTLVNSYSIGEILVASSAVHAANTKYDDINKQLNVQYNTEEQFSMARNKENSKINLSGFNHYWDLTLDVPCFKSVKNS